MDENQYEGADLSAHPLNFATIGCEVIGGNNLYSACLAAIGRVEHGYPSGGSNACQAAIEAGTCPALQLRERERREGRALNVRWLNQHDRSSLGASRRWTPPTSNKQTKSNADGHQSNKITPSSDMAAVVNKMLAKEDTDV